MLSLFDINLVKVELGSVGPSFTGIGVVGEGSEKVTPKWPPDNLAVPWQDLQANDVFSLLSWHAGVSDFVGRQNEMKELSMWAGGSAAVSVKFVTGEGGTGKSRLVAEFATDLQKRHWSAGFVNPRKVQSFPLRREGTLLVIDYPEESYQAVVELLADVGRPGKSHRMRILFLTRREVSDWHPAIHDANAAPLVDMKPVVLQRLGKEASHKLFCSAQECAAEVFNTVPIPVSEDDLEEWVRSAPENSRALFILSAAVYSALDPECEVLKYSRKEIVEALVEREATRLRRTAENYGFQSKATLAKLLALAAFAGELPTAIVDKLIMLPKSRLDFPAHRDAREILEEAGLMRNAVIPSPKPDILAAAFATIVLKDDHELAPDLIWACIEEDLEPSLERLARLSYDAEVVVGLHDQRISVWLAQALKNKPDRCAVTDGAFSKGNLPLSWQRAALVTWQVLLQVTTRDDQKARLLNNLSNVLGDVGERRGALDTIKEGVEIDRRLAAADPDVFELNLAMDLNTLANALSDVGDAQGALDAIREALKITRRLSAANPTRFDGVIASLLVNSALKLKDLGNTGQALDGIKEAVKVTRRLAQANPVAFEPLLAQGLDTLANVLSDVGDAKAALDAIKEAVTIHRRLAAANPARFEPNLATSLNNLAPKLRALGHTTQALGVMKEAVEIRRRLAAANPARFEPELAMSLNNLGAILTVLEDTARALDAMKEAADIYRRLSAATPARFEPDLAMSLNNLSTVLAGVGDTAGALDAIKQTVEIRRRLAAANPARFEPGLAISLNNLANRLSDARDGAGALDAIKEAVDIYRRLVTANPAAFEADLARSYHTLGEVWRSLGDIELACDAFKEGIRLLEAYAEAASEHPLAQIRAVLIEELRKTECT
jgi:tetratricopeptide (TPR) repeat protein